MLKTLLKTVDFHSIAELRVRVAHLEAENARFLGVVAAKEREILQLKGQISGRDAILRRRRDAEGKFA